MAMLPLLAGLAVAHPDVPLLAAGGTEEAIEIGDEYKAAVVASDGADTVFTRAYDITSGLPWPAAIGERVRRDAFTDERAGREAELRGRGDVAAPGRPILYGQSARFVTSVRKAADLVREVSAEAEAVLASRPAAVLRDR